MSEIIVSTYIRQKGPPGHFAVVELLFEKIAVDKSASDDFAEFVNKSDLGIDYVSAIEETVKEYAPSEYKVTLLGGKSHIIDSRKSSFRRATLDGILDFLREP